MRRVILAIVSTVASLVLVLSFKTHSPSAVATPPAAVSSTGTSAGTSGSGSSSSGSSSSGSSSSSSKKSTSGSKSYTGDAAMTRYGPVQVQITVKSGAVTSVAATDYPMNDSRDAQINSYAIPQLNSEAASAGNANIAMISGATYTSEGYLSSLQSALNKAGL